VLRFDKLMRSPAIDGQMICPLLEINLLSARKLQLFTVCLASSLLLSPWGVRGQDLNAPLRDAHAGVLIPRSATARSASSDADGTFELQPDFELSTQWLQGKEQSSDFQSEFKPDMAWAGTGEPVPDEAHLDLLPLFARWHRDFVERQRDGQEAAIEEGKVSQGYHWKPMLWQSLGFIAVENTFRLFTDPYMRYLIAEGPYWRNYGISMQHWDMNRWSDGDDFLVDDIGHPMQGAVSAFIAIQNSPRGRMQRIGTSKAYWKSRFWGLMWATVFSTQQKIGPLGEAALGNDGGYTYPLHCPIPCRSTNVEYTNNTGWTDFIMTPVGGTGWVIGEDLIDRFVTDKIQGDSNRVFFKILRGSLNPTRTMANALRGKTPWYRDYQHPEGVENGGVNVERSDADYLRHLPRYEIFPHFNSISLPVNTATCVWCRKSTNGAGAEFSMRLSRWVDFDSDMDFQPGASPYPTNRAGGDALIGTFGFRSGIVTRNYALKASLRPGFVSYNHALLAIPTSSNPTPGIGRVTHFATSLAINGDYGLTRCLAIRATFGNTPVRYLDYTSPPGIGTPPYVNWLSHNFFLTTENRMYQIGPVLRF